MSIDFSKHCPVCAALIRANCFSMEHDSGYICKKCKFVVCGSNLKILQNLRERAFLYLEDIYCDLGGPTCPSQEDDDYEKACLKAVKDQIK